MLEAVSFIAALAQYVNGSEEPAWLVPVTVLVVCVFYVLYAWLLYRIGRKLNYKDSWFAWVPVLNLYMLVDMSHKDTLLWFILIILTSWCCVGVVMLALVWMQIAARCDKDDLWGILCIIPIVNFFVMYYLGSGPSRFSGGEGGPGGYRGLPPPQRDHLGYPVSGDAPIEGYPPHQPPYPPQQRPQQPPQQPQQPPQPPRPPGEQPHRKPGKWV
jgi:hypothetical protein